MTRDHSNEEERNYYVWRSDERIVGVVRAKHAIDAAETYALRHKVPYGIALRVIPVADVMSLGLGITGGGSR